MGPQSPEHVFQCNHCEASFKTEKGLNIHIAKAHKIAALDTPEKERGISCLEEPTLNLTPTKVNGRIEEGDSFSPEEKTIEFDDEASETKVEPCPFCSEDALA